MKYLLLVDDFLPHSTKVAAKMMHDLALEFISTGHEVTVLTPNPKLNSRLEERIVDGVKVLFFKTGEYKNSPKFKRAINESLFSLRAWNAAKYFFINNPHDGIVYYSPSIFWGHLVGKLKKLWNVQSYLILRDIFPQWAIDNGIINRNTPVHLFFKYFEYINYRHADFIGVMSHSSVVLFESKSLIYNKCEVLYNWCRIMPFTEKNSKFRQELGLEDKVVFFYGGNIGHAQDMLNLVRLIKRMKSNLDVHFLFVGQGDEVDLILREKSEYQLDNLTYLPPVNQDTYSNMLNEFDVGLFSLHPSHSTNNFPGKLLGYMMHSKPILGSVNSGNDLKEIVNDAHCGFIFDSGQDESLYKAAVELSQSKELRNDLGENGRKLLLKHFSVKQAHEKIEKKFRRNS